MLNAILSKYDFDYNSLKGLRGRYIVDSIGMADGKARWLLSIRIAVDQDLVLYKYPVIQDVR